MKQKRHTTEEIIRILREADVGKDLEAVPRKHNVSAASFYRWKKKFGGMEAQRRSQVPALGKGKRRTQADARRQPAQDPRLGGGERKKRVGPSHKRRAVRGVVKAGLCSQRRACRYLGVHRSSHRHAPKAPSDWLLRLHGQIEILSRKPPPAWATASSCGFCAVRAGRVGRKLVQRIWREHGLRVRRWTKRPRRRGRSTGTIPTRAERINHVWTWDFSE